MNIQMSNGLPTLTILLDYDATEEDASSAIISIRFIREGILTRLQED